MKWPVRSDVSVEARLAFHFKFLRCPNAARSLFT